MATWRSYTVITQISTLVRRPRDSVATGWSANVTDMSEEAMNDTACTPASIFTSATPHERWSRLPNPYLSRFLFFSSSPLTCWLTFENTSSFSHPPSSSLTSPYLTRQAVKQIMEEISLTGARNIIDGCFSSRPPDWCYPRVGWWKLDKKAVAKIPRSSPLLKSPPFF